MILDGCNSAADNIDGKLKTLSVSVCMICSACVVKRKTRVFFAEKSRNTLKSYFAASAPVFCHFLQFLFEILSKDDDSSCLFKSYTYKKGS